MGIATTPEQHALQRSVADWAGRADLRAAARAGENAGAPLDLALWRQAAALGLIAAGLPAQHGGADGTALDAAVALEAAGRALVPGPVLHTALAAALLVRHPVSAVDLVPALAEGRRSGAVAIAGEPLTGTPGAGGHLLLDGVLPVLPGAPADGDPLLLLRFRDRDGESWAAVDASAEGVTRTPLERFDLATPVSALRCDGVRVPAERILHGLTVAGAREAAATLAAAEAAGIAAWTLDTASEYAKVRVQFGRPIGGFQAVKHLCAGMLCRREEAAAVAWDAAGALDGVAAESVTGGEAGLAAAVAASVALDAAVANARDCIQVLGGIGFTWEHDAHLYLRRALVLRQWLGGTGLWRARAAALARDGVRRPLVLPAATPAPGEDELRGRVRAVVKDLPAADPERRARLASSGFMVPHWPAPYGIAASAREQLVIEEELRRGGVGRVELGIAAWAVPTIVLHGTDEQRERFAGPSLRGEISWCQLFSEPDAGSDLASLRTRAVRAEGGWSLTGQKVWTSLAHTADWAICLARTDPDAARHAGITYFLVDMRSPGIDARPLREITGEALFNEVFLEDVFVPDACVVGPVNGGWKLARATLAQERVSMGGTSALGSGLEQLLASKGAETLGDDRLGGLVGRGSAVALVGLLGTAHRLAAEESRPGTAAPPGAESSVAKLLGVRHRQDVAEAAFEALGEAGLAAGPDSRTVQHELLLTRCLTIAGGTTQILLSLAAERLLGLPREPSGGRS